MQCSQIHQLARMHTDTPRPVTDVHVQTLDIEHQ
jgi:hypothetical protein